MTRTEARLYLEALAILAHQQWSPLTLNPPETFDAAAYLTIVEGLALTAELTVAERTQLARLFE